MKTDIYIKIVGTEAQTAKFIPALDRCFEMFREYEACFSRFRESSELTKFNQSMGGKVSPMFFDLMSYTTKAYRETGGMYDPTLLIRLHHLGYTGTLLPEAREGISFDTLIIDHHTRSISKPKELALDFGGIAKGYSVDRVRDFLWQQGFQNFLIDAGGDIYAAGSDPDLPYQSWVIDVENPFDTTLPFDKVFLSNKAIATSGKTRRHWTKNGNSYHHLIDPRTNEPTTHTLLSASLIASDTVTADVWAKVYFLLGPKEGMAASTKRGDPIFLIDEQGATFRSPAWETWRWSEYSLLTTMKTL